ncbi:exodeoxyribonuclease VII large subunit [Aestuariimicrobium sp. T2.26MG-19.2B]|uniref:exodeoxyribonuclease VII large subunit n=1 Tax=Aestuariimicrobium sp. T2.26MG-19.2B TaxID=3040679 RepID=UPI0024778F43|nr:exodeoxyribonuclease VII large subunit [Aestuariimicrobium sp. T2.26MG-19.2B]CAI9400488.1 Exodeoxyribonuclease 7 large subunit [Aestuariimicrobium sp. T2.26MG-19.2B]
MPLPSSPEQPQPLGRVIAAAAEWVNRLGEIWVEAEVVQIKRYQGATQFLTLRDKNGSVTADGTCSRLVLDQVGPLTDGTTVAARVKPRMWPKSAKFSLEVLELRVVGVGRLLAQLEQLKAKLRAEGLFESHHKRRLPFLPRAIGLVTGEGSAAERDVLATIAARWPDAHVEVRHSLVQGPDAAGQVMQRLAELDRHPGVDVIIIARGGGSLEDLLPFSDEGLVRAVAACRTPVISAIGHEPDTPIVDLVADFRAATPTAAAKAVVPDVSEQRQAVTADLARLRQSLLLRLGRAEADLDSLTTRPVMRDPIASFAVHVDQLAQWRRRLTTTIGRALADESRTVDHQLQRVRSMSPKATLERGYAILVDGEDRSITSVHDIDEGDDLLAYVADGTLILEARGVHEGRVPNQAREGSSGPLEREADHG